MTATNDALDNPYGQSIAHITKGLVEKEPYNNVIAGTTGFGKDVIPRLGGLLDVQAITDVVKIVDGGAKFVVQSGDALKVVSDTASSLDVWVSTVDAIST